MKAAVYHGPHDIRIEEVEEPKLSGTKVAVRFKAGSICGTDMHFYRGDWKIKKGRIVGHDAWGVREDTGERVVIVPVANCGHCYFCQRGLPACCERGKFYGITTDGFFAETKAINPRSLIPIPANVDDEEAAVVEPVALAIRTLDYLKPNMADWVTIIGQGPIGLLMTQVARLKGCRVIAVDLKDDRLELAQKFGAEAVVNAQKEDVIEAVRKLTKKGPDIVIEAAGTTRTVEQTPFLVRKAGKVALIGESEGYLNLGNVEEAIFFTIYLSPVEYPLAVELIARKAVDVKGLISHRFRFEDFEKALQTAGDPAHKPVKVIITKQ